MVCMNNRDSVKFSALRTMHCNQLDSVLGIGEEAKIGNLEIGHVYASPLHVAAHFLNGEDKGLRGFQINPLVPD